MDVDQPPLSHPLLKDMEEVMNMVVRSFDEDPSPKPSNSYYGNNLPGALLSLAIHFWAVMKRDDETVTLPSNSEEVFRARCMSYKEKARVKLYQCRNGPYPVPTAWHPDRELTPASLGSDAIAGVDGYVFLKMPQQMILARFLVRITLTFRKVCYDKFKADPLAIRLFVLQFSYNSWEANIVESAPMATYAPLVAYYNHLERFLELTTPPATHDGPLPLPPLKLTLTADQSLNTPYPAPVAETSSKPAFAIMSALETFSHQTNLYALPALNDHLEDLHTAHAVVCLDHSKIADSPYAKTPSAELARHLEALSSAGPNVTDATLVWFDTLCEVAKSAKFVKKRHYYVGWEEQDHIFRFAWEWKTLPSPGVLKGKDRPITMIATLLARWARYVKPDCRFKVAVKILDIMLSACNAAEDAEAKRKLVASRCFPRLLWLIPPPSFSAQVLTPDPLCTFLLLIPEITAGAMNLRLWFMNVIFTAICVPSRTTTPSKMDIKRSDFEIESSLADLRRAPAPANQGVNIALQPKMDFPLHEYLKTIPSSTKEIAGTATEILLWANYRLAVTPSRKFESFAQALAQQIAAYPEVIPSIIDAIIENCATSKVPILALLLKVAMTDLRVSYPPSEFEAISPPPAADTARMVVD